MKSMNIYLKGLLVAALTLGTGAVMTSCEDEPDKYEIAKGKPTVHYVRNLGGEVDYKDPDPNHINTQGQLVTEADPQSTLCLVGDNMRSIVKLLFNDQEAILVTSYITDHSLIVQVPESVPKAVTDKIYMITSAGDTVTFDFHVIIPGPQLTAMDFEYAQPGTDVTITGRYLIDDPAVPLKCYFLDASGAKVEATVNSISNDYTTMNVTIPATADMGKVTVENVYGKVTSSFLYKDSGNGKDSWMLFDFDGGGAGLDGSTGKVGHGWHSVLACNDEWSISGAYMQLGNGDAKMDDETWDDGNFSFEYWPGDWMDVEDYSHDCSGRLIDIADFSGWEKMSLKFEMCIPQSNPWSAAALQIIPHSTATVTNGNAVTDIYGLQTGGCNNKYVNEWHLPRALYRPWTTTGKYDTGDKWITVTIPLATSLVFDYDGSGLEAKLTPADFAGLTMFVASGGQAGEECHPIIKIDNIRVVKN